MAAFPGEIVPSVHVHVHVHFHVNIDLLPDPPTSERGRGGANRGFIPFLSFGPPSDILFMRGMPPQWHHRQP